MYEWWRIFNQKLINNILIQVIICITKRSNGVSNYIYDKTFVRTYKDFDFIYFDKKKIDFHIHLRRWLNECIVGCFFLSLRKVTTITYFSLMSFSSIVLVLCINMYIMNRKSNTYTSNILSPFLMPANSAAPWSNTALTC